MKMSKHVVKAKVFYLLGNVIGNLNEHPAYIYIFILLRNHLNVIPHPQCIILTTFLNKYVVKVMLLCLLGHVIGNFKRTSKSNLYLHRMKEGPLISSLRFLI